MAESTAADLKPGPGIYQSSRGMWAVLVGQDNALHVVQAITSGDDAMLKSLLSQPRWIKIMFEKPHTIYYQNRPSQDSNDVRPVDAMPMPNIERAVTIAATNGQAIIVSTLLDFAVQHGLNPLAVVNRWAVNMTIQHGHAHVFEALAQADPKVVTFQGLGHGTLPLYEAVRLRQPEVLAVLLKLGADPLHPVGRDKTLYSYNSSLLGRAAAGFDTRMVELLLEHNVPIAGSGALHTAAALCRFDSARLLLARGADVNEELPGGYKRWTPMHFAAWKGQAEAMELLVSYGARSDVKDDDGKTPAQVLEEYVPEDWRRKQEQ